MPGFEIERFVNLSQIEKNELTCSICHDIFRCPVVANCCLKTFCEDCINDWLKTNKSCPHDGKELNANQLTGPSRVKVNMLGKLKLKCDYREKGCKEVLMLENLPHHLLSCRYNVNNCNKTPLELNKQANEEIDTLKKKCESITTNIRPETSARSQSVGMEESLSRELRELKLENEKLEKHLFNAQDRNSSNTTTSTTKELPISRAGPKTTFTSSSEISEQEILNEARKHLSNPDITQNETTEIVTNKIISIVLGEIREHNSMFIVCKNIVDKLNQEFGNRWHCIANYNNLSNCFFTYETGYLIKFKFGKLLLEIYKTQFHNLEVMRQRFRSGKIKREIKILRSDMKEIMILDLKRITFLAIEKYETLTDITSYIKNQMESKYGGHWQCFIFSYFGNFSISYSTGKYISFEFAELTIIVYQATA